MQVIARPVRHQLGAEELLELGRASHGTVLGRSPFLANRPQMGRTGIAFSDVADFVSGALGFNLSVLGDLLGVSAGSLSQGVDSAFRGLAALVDSAPALEALLGQILLLGAVAVKFDLSVPGPSSDGISRILFNIASVLAAKNTTADNQKIVDKSKDLILSQAPASILDVVRTTLDGAGVTGESMTPVIFSMR